MLLGLLGLALSAVLLALDWAAFEDRSSTQTLVLCAGLATLALGGYLARSPRAAAQHLLAGILIAGTFLTITCLVVRYRNPHFFPSRSRTLLQIAPALSLLSAIVLYLLSRGARDAES